MTKAEDVLSRGLSTGFAGGAISSDVKRGQFALKSGAWKEAGNVYHDEWAEGWTGGGQELVKTDEGKVYTRVYAGGSISQKALEQVGVDGDQLEEYLKNKLITLEGQTRLHDSCQPEPDGKWHYSYSILYQNPDIPVTVGLETIVYNGKIVFVHSMTLCPVE